MFASLDIDNKAVEYFNTVADELLLVLQPFKKRLEEKELPSCNSQRYAEVIDINDGNLNSFMMQDGFGNILSRYFRFNQGLIGLDEESFQRFLQLVDGLLKKQNIKIFLSKEFIENTIFEWFENRYKGKLTQETTLTNYLETKSKSAVKNHKVSIPLVHFAIEDSFKLGSVQYELLTKDFFDTLVNKLSEYNKESEGKENLEKRIFRLRKEYQGVVFATMNIESEKNKAIERTIEIIDNHLKLFKCFSATTFIPEIPTYFDRKGHTKIPMSYVLLFESDVPNEISWIDEKMDFDFRIDNKRIKDFYNLGYSKSFELIDKEKRSDLEDTYLNIITLFSKSISANEFQDKLVYTLVALELLLLKNDSEPIQNSVGIRLAFLTRKKVEDRRKVIKLVKDCYKIRSSYIHHGKIKREYILLQQLQFLVWQAIINLIRSIDNFNSQNEFVEYIEELILK